MTALLKEKQAHIESLEEKHRHSREALEHYRESVKEQQIQQLQAEIRTLNQTISVKQGDLTHLNKDNARLVSELNAARKTAHDLESKLNNADAKLENAGTRLQAQTTELTQYKSSTQRQGSQIN